MMTVWPSAAPSSVDMARASKSCTPPAAKGTTMRAILVLDWARALPAARARPVPRKFRRCIMECFLSGCGCCGQWRMFLLFRFSVHADFIGQAAHKALAPGELVQRDPFVGLVC